MSTSQQRTVPPRSIRRKKTSGGQASLVEVLEPRCVLAAPEFVGLADALPIRAGTALNIPLNAFDADGDALTFSVSIDNPLIEAMIPEGNRSVRFTLTHESSGLPGDVAFTDDITFEMLEGIAPNTTKKFIDLVESGAYDGLTFFRLVSGFAAQFGDPNGVGTGGSGITIDDEFSKYGRHTSFGLLSTAKSLDDTFDMQAFLTLGIDSTRQLDFNHVVFGVTTTIGSDITFNVPVEANRVTGEISFPVRPIVIESTSVFIDDENGVLRLFVPDDVAIGTTANLTLTVTDSNGEFTTEVVTVEVLADNFNDNPFFSPDPQPQITDFGVPVSFTLQATDIENDPIEFLEGSANDYASRGLVKEPNLQVDIDSVTGEVTVTPTGQIAGVIPVLVKVRHLGGGPEDFQVVPIIIRPFAPLGVSLLSDSGVLDDGITAANNSSGLPLEFVVDGVFFGAPVQLLIDGVSVDEQNAPEDGSMEFTLDGSSIFPDGDYTITARFVARDTLIFGNFDPFEVNGLETDPLIVTIDTRPVIFESSPNLVAAVTVPYTYDAQTDQESEPGLVYQLDVAPAGMTIDPATGLIQWTPVAAQAGETPVTIRATNVAGSVEFQSFTIITHPEPVLLEVGNQTVDEGFLLDVQLIVEDAEVGDTFTFELIGAVPDGAAIDNTGRFTFTPTEAQGPGSFDISVRVTDIRGASGETMFAVQVDEVQQAPVFDAIVDPFVLPGTSLSFVIAAFDPDIPQRSIVFSLAPGSPAGAAIDPSTGLFTFDAPAGASLGVLPVTVRATEGSGEGEISSTTTFNIIVVDNLPPLFPDQTMVFATKASELLEFDVVAVDPDPVPVDLEFSLDPGAPAFVSIDPTTGRVTVTTERDTPLQTFDVVVRVTEIGADEFTTTKTFTVEITTPPNLPPVFPDQPMAFTTEAGAPLLFDVAAIDPDDSPVPLAFSLEPGTPDFVAIDPFTGQVTVSPERLTPPQTVDVVVRVTEISADALSATETFTVEITAPPNLPPVFPAQPTEFTTEVGDLLFFDVTAIDPAPGTSPLAFSLEPGAATVVSIDRITGRVTVTSTPETLPQTFQFVVRATEVSPDALSTTQAFTVNLVPVSNQSPVINPVAKQEVRRGLEIRFAIGAVDPDTPPSPLIYRLAADAPPEASIDPTTGEVTFRTTAATAVGLHRFGVEVNEDVANGLGAAAVVEVEVLSTGVREFVGIGNSRFGPAPVDRLPATNQQPTISSIIGLFPNAASSTTTSTASPLATPDLSDGFPITPNNNITFGADTGVGRSFTPNDGTTDESDEEQPNDGNIEEDANSVAPAQATEEIEDTNNTNNEKPEGDASTDDTERDTPSAAVWDDRLIDWATTEHWAPGHETFARSMNASVNRSRQEKANADPYDIDLEPLVVLPVPGMSTSASVTDERLRTGFSSGASSTVILPAPKGEAAAESSVVEEPLVSEEIATVVAVGVAFYTPLLVTDLPEAKQSKSRWRNWLRDGGQG